MTYVRRHFTDIEIIKIFETYFDKPSTCVRRMNGIGSWEREPNLDNWIARPGSSEGTYSLTCSFCGSLNPDLVIYIMENCPCEIGPTDKNYKMYFNFDIDGASMKHGKFYFQHLSDEQRTQFIKILNEKVYDAEKKETNIKIGYPHRFYVLPYFAVEREEVGIEDEQRPANPA